MTWLLKHLVVRHSHLLPSNDLLFTLALFQFSSFISTVYRTVTMTTPWVRSSAANWSIALGCITESGNVKQCFQMLTYSQMGLRHKKKCHFLICFAGLASTFPSVSKTLISSTFLLTHGVKRCSFISIIRSWDSLCWDGKTGRGMILIIKHRKPGFEYHHRQPIAFLQGVLHRIPISWVLWLVQSKIVFGIVDEGIGHEISSWIQLMAPYLF